YSSRDSRAIFCEPCDEARQHLDTFLLRISAADVVFVGVSPQLEFPDECLRQVARLFQIERDNTGADIGAADVDGENRIVRLEHPTRRQARGPTQTAFVRS